MKLEWTKENVIKVLKAMRRLNIELHAKSEDREERKALYREGLALEASIHLLTEEGFFQKLVEIYEEYIEE